MKKKKWIGLVVMSAVVLVAVAANWPFSFLNGLYGGEEPSDPVLSTDAVQKNDTYFDDARYARLQSREEAIALLNSVIEDDSVTEEIRANAYEEVVAYAKITEGETALEGVLKAKGFEECIVYLTKESATVVVSAETLTDQQTVQIFDAVLGQTGMKPNAVKIVTYY